jgi:hypothetical protein
LALEDYPNCGAETSRPDRECAVSVTSFVRTGYNTDRVTRLALATLDSLELPRG